MGSVGLGSSLLNSLGTQYDFKNMTQSQVVDTANKLLAEGKITTTDAGTLDGFACASVDGPDAFSPTNPKDYNFISMIQLNVAASESLGMTKAATNDENLLQDLAPYQAQS
jgi:hypothetical protein